MRNFPIFDRPSEISIRLIKVEIFLQVYDEYVFFDDFIFMLFVSRIRIVLFSLKSWNERLDDDSSSNWIDKFENFSHLENISSSFFK